MRRHRPCPRGIDAGREFVVGSGHCFNIASIALIRASKTNWPHMSAIKSMMARSEGFEPPTPRFEVRFELAPFQLVELHSISPARARLQDNALAKISQAHLDILASARWPASVIRTWVTSVCRSLVPMRSVFVVACPALTRSSSIPVEAVGQHHRLGATLSA